MSIIEAIKAIYSDLRDDDFETIIVLQNDSDGRGDYIRKWDHPTYTQPTDEELTQAGLVK